MAEITREYLKGLQSFDTEEDYRSSPSINYSTLKDIPNGPQCLVAEHRFKRSSAFEIGDYVDKYFTDRDALDELYEQTKPKIELSDSLEILYNAFVDIGCYEPTLDSCVLVARDCKLWTKMGDEKIKERITDDFFKKLKEAIEDTGKIKMTTDQHLQARYAIENILLNDYAIDLITEKENEIIIPQFKYEFDMPIENAEPLTCKIMLDFLKFDIANKKIYGIDLKTGAKPPHRFGEQFVEYRYDIQGILYYFGMMQLRKKYFPDWKKCSPKDFLFLYTQKRIDTAPVIVRLTDEFVRDSCETLYANNLELPGIGKLLDDTSWYLANQYFDSHRIIFENGGILNIDDLI